MFNWLWSAISRARASLEIQQTTARVDQLELEWNDVLDKLRAREERERKRKKADVVAAAAPCTDCGPDDSSLGGQGVAPLKSDLWAQRGSLRGRVQ